jgi:hypothetical protein
MQWERPSYSEVNMNAEVGGYQDDFGRRGDPASGDQNAFSDSLQGRPEEVDLPLATL